MTQDHRARAGQAISEAVTSLLRAGRQPAGPVAAYSSFGSEPPTGPLLSALATAGVAVLLPVLLPDGDLDWSQDGASQGREAIGRCPLVVVPALLVDRGGNRLGRGGGSYDRALTRAAGALTVAALYDEELVDRLPVEPHDVPVRSVLLPARGLVPLPLT